MSETAKTTVILAPEVDDFVRGEVERGAAASVDDYVNDVLRAQQDELWTQIQVGIDDIEAGHFTSVDEAFASVREEFGLKKSASK
jgi:antitoxin ParD1/3/4